MQATHIRVGLRALPNFLESVRQMGRLTRIREVRGRLGAITETPIEISGGIGHQPSFIKIFVFGRGNSNRDEARQTACKLYQAMSAGNDWRAIEQQDAHLCAAAIHDQFPNGGAKGLVVSQRKPVARSIL